MWRFGMKIWGFCLRLLFVSFFLIGYQLAFAQSSPDDDDIAAQTEDDGIGGGGDPAPPLGDIQSRYNSYNLDVLGDGLVGDHADLDTGALSITHTDVSIPGNFDLPVAFGRTLSRSFIGAEWIGNWQANVPYIARNYLEEAPPGNDRCTGQLYPSPIDYNNTFILAPSYFDGFTLSIPGRNIGKLAQELNGGGSPEFSGTSARMVTKNNWLVECISSIPSGGEGYEAVAPNGDRYKFDYRQTYFERAADFGPNAGVSIREEVLYATEITDVNGNWVRYDYSGGKLNRIHSSDLREITFGYTGNRITTVSANTRTWTYAYDGIYLETVTLPDGREWEFSLSNVLDPFWSAMTGICAGHNSTDFFADLEIKHPDGTMAIFDFTAIMNGRTYADSYLRDPGTPHPTVDDCFVGSVGYKNPSGFYSIALKKKQLILAGGGTTYVWTRDYEQDFGTHNNDGNPFNYLDVKKRTVTDPLGQKTVSYFNRRFNQYEGTLEKVEIIPAGSSVPIQTITNSYIVGNYVGIPLSAVEHNGATNFSDNTRIYKTQTVTTRDGDTYTTETDYNDDETANDFSYGHPTSTSVFSNITPTPRETVTTYAHNTSKWVLGLPDTITQNGRELASYAYDSLGRKTSQTRYGQFHASFTYHTHSLFKGALAITTDALARQVYRTNYKRGTAQNIRRSDNRWLYSTVDDNGWLLTSKDAANNLTSYNYDAMGRLTLLNPPLYADTVIGYNFSGGGAVQTITQGDSQSIITYDSLFRPVLEQTKDLTTNISHYVNTDYDALGRAVFSSFPSAIASEMDGTDITYDALGRTTKTRETVAPYAEVNTAYYNQHRKRVTDAEGNITTTYHNGYGGGGYGEVIKIFQPEQIYSIMVRNIHGELERAYQFGTLNGVYASTHKYYYYDDQRRLCRFRTTEGGTTLYDYDAAGQMIASAKGQAYGTSCAAPSGSNLVSQSYDVLGRPDVTDFYDPSTPDIDRTYDFNGNITALTRDGYNWTYGYTGNLQLNYERLAIDGKVYLTRYTYDAQGRRDGIRHPYSTTYVDYDYNGFGEVTSVKKGASTYASGASYHPSGALYKMTYGNNQLFTQTLTPRLQPDRMWSFKGSQKALDLSYTYDDNGRIESTTDGAVSGNSRTYGYDGAGRLTSATGPWGVGGANATASYQYDSTGNLRVKSMSGGGANRVVTLDRNGQNRITQSADTGAWAGGTNTTGTRVLGYDNKGNVTSLGNLSMAYDASDQPTIVTGDATGGSGSSGMATANYWYDGNLKRVKSITNGKTIYNVYLSDGTLIFIDNIATGKKTEYIKGPQGTLARIEAGVITYLHPDHLGSAQSGTTASGTVLWREKYTPYGESLLNPAANDNQAGFTGHIKDSDTGLINMQARFMDPSIGRFLSIDPVGFMETGQPGQFNRYAYTWNDPINRIDPDGRYSLESTEQIILDVAYAAYKPVIDFFTEDAIDAVESAKEGDIRKAAGSATLAVVKPVKIARKLKKLITKRDGVLDGDVPKVDQLKDKDIDDNIATMNQSVKARKAERAEHIKKGTADKNHDQRLAKEENLTKQLEKRKEDRNLGDN